MEVLESAESEARAAETAANRAEKKRKTAEGDAADANAAMTLA